jgi:transposase, IS5 family
VATTLKHSKGGQFIAHVKALPGKPYDGHTLATVLPDIELKIGATIERVIADAGYKGHNAPANYRFKVYTAGQKRKMTDEIKREMRRRSAVEPVTGHLKGDHRMDRNHLAGAAGDAVNAVLAAVGYNFRRLLAWLGLLLAAIRFCLTKHNATDYQSSAPDQQSSRTTDWPHFNYLCWQAEPLAPLASAAELKSKP